MLPSAVHRPVPALWTSITPSFLCCQEPCSLRFMLLHNYVQWETWLHWEGQRDSCEFTVLDQVPAAATVDFYIITCPHSLSSTCVSTAKNKSWNHFLYFCFLPFSFVAPFKTSDITEVLEFVCHIVQVNSRLCFLLADPLDQLSVVLFLLCSYFCALAMAPYKFSKK